MIVFDLACPSGHVFEAWFGSPQDYDDQQSRGLVSCPVCGKGKVEKAPMAPRIGHGSAPAATDRASVLKAMMAVQAEIVSRSENVGGRFAEEARAIHAGEADDRLIHGRATREEARELLAEGVPVAPLPFLVRDPARDN